MAVVVGAVAGSFAADAVATYLGGTLLAQIGGAIVGSVVSRVVSRALGAGRDDDQATAARFGTQVNTASTVAPIPVIYGLRRVGGNRIFTHVSESDTRILYLLQTVCEGPVESIPNVYLDDIASTDDRWAADGGYATKSIRLGDANQLADDMLFTNVGHKITAAHKQSGVATIAMQLVYTLGAGYEPKFPNGVPVITADVYGRTVYDPRSAVTVWHYNPALCLRDYLTNTIYGRGIDEDLIDDDSFGEAATYCDELVTIPDGMGGTTTQERYSCDAVLSPDNDYLDNVRAILSSCRGWLVYAGGFYKLILDKKETPSSFEFNEDNIVGRWQITLPGKRTRFNRVKAGFINSARSWQPDLAIYDSTAHRTEDNEILLEREIDLPATTNYYRAYRLAQLEERASRFGIVAQFTATVAGLQCAVGDVVPITHSTPGWESKPFRILRMRLLSTDEVEVTAMEYDDSVYDESMADVPRETPTTNLPDPFNVQAPGALTITEELYTTRDRTGVKARAIMTWGAAPDGFVRQYQPEYKTHESDSCTVLPLTTATTIDVNDIAPGDYDFRVLAINSFGRTSSYSTARYQISGLSAPPDALTGLTIQTVGGLAILQWTQSTDQDVLIGGRIDIRHSNSESGGPIWAEATPIGAPCPGMATLAVVPLKSGTYFVRPYDSTGNAGDTTSVSTSGATALEFTNLDTLTEDPTFSGTKTNTVVSSSKLKLDSLGNFDAQTDVDAIVDVDSIGGIKPSGSYAFATTMDLTSVTHVRLISRLVAEVVQVSDRVDQRGGEVDDWPTWDGDVDGDEAQAHVEYRSTPDDPAGTPTWSDWNRLDAAEAYARGFQFRAQLVTSDPDFNIEISALSVDADKIV